MPKALRPIAIHLPQFHPIAENDLWWGKGFTEWTNVAKAKPLVNSHYQPQLPADLGFYDLRLEEARLAQIALAKQYGIFGFCYYHYWFNGKRLLHEPLDRMLANKKEDFPFMLCWANENWTRAWDGQNNEVLIAQNYNEADDLQHIQFLCDHFFSDARYIRINGKPFIAIYRIDLFKDIKKTIALWRAEAKRNGIGELYVAYVKSFGQHHDLSALNLDAAIEFAPHFDHPEKEHGITFNKLVSGMIDWKTRAIRKLGIKQLKNVNQTVDRLILDNLNSKFHQNAFLDYNKLVSKEIKRLLPEKTYPSLFPGWDNSPRKKKNALIYLNNTPAAYKKWLLSIIERFEPFGKEENFVFINAWNEWAEGNHLEPCVKWGSAYLEATQEALNETETSATSKSS